MIRVARFRAEMALEVLEAAKDANDALVADACRRVRQGWLLGRKASASDISLVEEFHQ